MRGEVNNCIVRQGVQYEHFEQTIPIKKSLTPAPLPSDYPDGLQSDFAAFLPTNAQTPSGGTMMHETALLRRVVPAPRALCRCSDGGAARCRCHPARQSRLRRTACHVRGVGLDWSARGGFNRRGPGRSVAAAAFVAKRRPAGSRRGRHPGRTWPGSRLITKKDSSSAAEVRPQAPGEPPMEGGDFVPGCNAPPVEPWNEDYEVHPRPIRRSAGGVAGRARCTAASGSTASICSGGPPAPSPRRC